AITDLQHLDVTESYACIQIVPAPSVTAGCGGSACSHACGTNSVCIAMSFMCRVQIRRESGALDVPWELWPPPLTTRRKLLSRAKFTASAMSWAFLAATA